jgi:hypothetical protein
MHSDTRIGHKYRQIFLASGAVPELPNGHWDAARDSGDVICAHFDAPCARTQWTSDASHYITCRRRLYKIYGNLHSSVTNNVSVWLTCLLAGEKHLGLIYRWVKIPYRLQHTELKRVDTDSRQTGVSASAPLPAVTRNGLSEKWGELSDKIMSCTGPITHKSSERQHNGAHT